MTATAASAPIAPVEAPQRRCIVTGEVRERTGLLRCVVGPDGAIVPDIEGRLPGRGLWLTPRRDIVERALQKRLFARAARRPVAVPPELADRIESLLARRCSDLLGLARRAGQAVAGFERVGEAVRAGRAELLLEACDGAEAGRRRLAALGPGLPTVSVLTATELGAAFGRERVVHAAVGGGRLAARLLTELARLAGMRQAAAVKNGTGVAPGGPATADGGCKSHD
ncbi:MAG TPA: RNA-binding protein [Stellaceae bacterium]|nr:RNA-binding protein [Stellaceae bacterium]